jgi:hypothetical protein
VFQTGEKRKIGWIEEGMKGTELVRNRGIDGWMDCTKDWCTDGRTDGWMDDACTGRQKLIESE